MEYIYTSLFISKTDRVSPFSNTGWERFDSETRWWWELLHSFIPTLYRRSTSSIFVYYGHVAERPPFHQWRLWRRHGAGEPGQPGRPRQVPSGRCDVTTTARWVGRGDHVLSVSIDRSGVPTVGASVTSMAPTAAMFVDDCYPVAHVFCGVRGSRRLPTAGRHRRA